MIAGFIVESFEEKSERCVRMMSRWGYQGTNFFGGNPAIEGNLPELNGISGERFAPFAEREFEGRQDAIGGGM